MSRYWARVRLEGESEALTTRDRKPRISRFTDWAFILAALHSLPAQILPLEYEAFYPWSSVISVV